MTSESTPGRRGGAARDGTPDRADPARSTTPQRDEASTTVPAPQAGGDAPYADLKMPHERDESAQPGPKATPDGDGTRAVTRQGAADVQSGQQDTDCYNANAPRYRKREGTGP